MCFILKHMTEVIGTQKKIFLTSYIYSDNIVFHFAFLQSIFYS
uniref:Uncharacterized protein n=1 Tax=Anguilla anguilla TaxID=7936 RepID=A0A0E9UXG1_ANGAN